MLGADSTLSIGRSNVAGMPPGARTPQSTATDPRATASRSWRASLIRKPAQILGDMETSRREAAEAAPART